MIDNPASFATVHPNISYWIDVGIKLGALILGGIWTFWNSRKSRTYAQKLDLQLSGDVFFKDDLYIDVSIVLTNLGAAKHILQPEGTSCEIVAVQKDLSQESVRLFSVFTLHSQIEPGEAIGDHVLWRIPRPSPDIVWLKIDLRVVSGKVEWNRTSVVRVADEPAEQ
jgi:hypothetical protein